MGFLIGTIQAVSSALALTLDKRLLALRTVGTDWQAFLYRAAQLAVMAPLMALGLLTVPAQGFAPFLEAGNLGMLACSVGLLYATYPLRRYAYMNEKVTVLQPFAMSKQLFSVLIAFAFVAQERANPWPAVFALAAMAVIGWSQTGKEGLRFSRGSLLLAGAMLVLAVQSFFTLYFVRLVGGSPYYFAEGLAVAVLTAAALVGKGAWREAGKLNRRWLAGMLGNAMLGLLSALIIMELYRSRGMIASNLVQLFYVAFVFVFSVAILREKPTLKDGLVSAAVAACVAAGTMMK